MTNRLGDAGLFDQEVTVLVRRSKGDRGDADGIEDTTCNLLIDVKCMRNVVLVKFARLREPADGIVPRRHSLATCPRHGPVLETS